jgi:hypothetical protein
LEGAAVFRSAFTDATDAARLELLLTDLRLPAPLMKFIILASFCQINTLWLYNKYYTIILRLDAPHQGLEAQIFAVTGPPFIAVHRQQLLGLSQRDRREFLRPFGRS